MALLCLDDNGLHQEIAYCPWQTKLETRQEIADYLIRRLREKNYAAWLESANFGANSPKISLPAVIFFMSVTPFH